MSKGNKCSNCLKLLKAAQERLSKRKDWEVKGKEADKERIAYWQEKYNNPKEMPENPPRDYVHICYCYGGDIIPTTLPGQERSCDKCKKQWSGNEYEDFPPNDHVCEGRKYLYRLWLSEMRGW